MNREEQKAIGTWIGATFAKGEPASPQSEFLMAVNAYAQSATPRQEAVEKATASVRARHPSFTPLLVPVADRTTTGRFAWLGSWHTVDTREEAENWLQRLNTANPDESSKVLAELNLKHPPSAV
jgi:hypothetical protein